MFTASQGDEHDVIVVKNGIAINREQQLESDATAANEFAGMLFRAPALSVDVEPIRVRFSRSAAATYGSRSN